jgi:hypothetical protein
VGGVDPLGAPIPGGSPSARPNESGHYEVIPDPLGCEAARAGAARRIGTLIDAERLVTRVGAERIVRSGVQ